MLEGRRIVLVLKSFRFGGAERQAMLLARHLAETAGARVFVLGYSAPEERVARMCQETGLPHGTYAARLHGKWYKLLPALAGLTRYLRKLEPDVLISFLNVPNITCGAIWRLTGAHTTIWCQRNEGMDLIGRPIERFAIRNTPCFVANSRVGADVLLEKGARPERVQVIPNAVSLPAPRNSSESWRRRLDAGPAHRVAAMVAHFRPPKDHATLLRAWALVVEEIATPDRPLLLALAGLPGPCFEESRDLARRLGVDGSIRFVGATRDIAGLLGAIDLGVHSSLSEGCPNAVQEFMDAGLPVAATDLPSIRMLLGGSDHLAPKKDAEGLAAAITPLLEDEELRREVGKRNRARVESSFRPEEICRRWDRLISSCLER